MRHIGAGIYILFSAFFLSAQQPFPGNGVVFNEAYIPKIYVNINEAHLDDLYLVENWFSNDYYTAQLVFESIGVKDTIENIGLRFRGNTARQKIKKSFKISFNEFEPGRRYRGLKKLNLNAEPNDPSMVRSHATVDLFKRYHIPAPRINHVEVYINGEYYGLYQNTEHIDSEFLDKYFGNKKGNLYKGSYPCDLDYISNNPEDYKALTYPNKRFYDLKTNKGADDYRKLATFIGFLNKADNESFKCDFFEYFNVIDYLRIAAIDVLTGNWDGYIFNSNNLYLYENPLSNRIDYIPYDLDNTWGLDWFGYNWATRNIYNYSRPNEMRPLYERLMDEPEFRDIFSWYVKNIVDEYYNTPAHRTWIEELHTLITPSALNDPYRPLDFGFTEPKFLNALHQTGAPHVKQGVLTFADIRKQKVYEQVEDVAIPPFLRSIELNFDSWPASFAVKAITDGPKVETAKLHYILNGDQNGEIVIHAGDNQTQFLFIPELPSQPVEFSYNIELIGENGLSRTVFCENRKIIWEPHQPGLMINEVVSKNTWTIADEHGDYHDWIELFNAGAEPVNLKKYFLSDKSHAPMLWNLPDVTMEPGSHLLFWADGNVSAGGMHANFSVKSSGEKIYLFKKDKKKLHFVDGIKVPALSANVSYGRESDGAPNWIEFTTPTPNAPNQIDIGLETTDSEMFNIFPNPTQGVVHFSETVDYKLIDIAGRVIETNRGKIINLSSFSNGLYFIAIGNQVYKISKI